MTFTVNDFADLRQLLLLHPEWRAELRQLIIPDDMLDMPALLRELAQSHLRAEHRLDRIEAILAESARRDQRRDARLDRLEKALADLAEAQQRTDAKMAESQQRTDAKFAELAAAQQRTEAKVAELAAARQRTEAKVEHMAAALGVVSSRLDQLTDRVTHLTGRELERHYRERAAAFFGRWLRPVKLALSDALRETLEASLSEEEVEDVMRLDLLIQGRARHLPHMPERLVALEISTVVDRGDVERARRYAALLQRTGLHAAPAVAGERLTTGAVEASEEAPMIVLMDGQSNGWDQALAVA